MLLEGPVKVLKGQFDEGVSYIPVQMSTQAYILKCSIGCHDTSGPVTLILTHYATASASAMRTASLQS